MIEHADASVGSADFELYIYIYDIFMYIYIYRERERERERERSIYIMYTWRPKKVPGDPKTAQEDPRASARPQEGPRKAQG